MSLPALNVVARLGRLRASLEGLDAFLVTHLPNVRYLTGFTGSAGTLLVGGEDALLVTDGRYGEQANEQLGAVGCDARIEVAGTGQRELLARVLADWGVTRVGLEAHSVTWAQHDDLAEAVAPRELVATRGLVEALRRVKEPGEVARIRTACAIADEAFVDVRSMITAHPTERAVALALEIAMRDLGAQGNSFDPIVASGPNSAKPHARPTAREIGAGELVVLDFGCIVDGYCSDMSRTVSAGDPGHDARHVYDVVTESQRAGCGAVRSAVECAAVDGASRAVIDGAGLGEYFTHGTGHGVGLEIHEAPKVAASSSDTLARGHVVTVEPGVYLPGVGGVRIEDTVVVTDEGADILTSASKELVL